MVDDETGSGYSVVRSSFYNPDDTLIYDPNRPNKGYVETRLDKLEYHQEGLKGRVINIETSLGETDTMYIITCKCFKTTLSCQTS